MASLTVLLRHHVPKHFSLTSNEQIRMWWSANETNCVVTLIQLTTDEELNEPDWFPEVVLLMHSYQMRTVKKLHP